VHFHLPNFLATTADLIVLLCCILLYAVSDLRVVDYCRCAGDPDSKISNTRAKHWQTYSDQCSGSWVREVCNVAWADLPWIIAAPEMFINKIRLEESPLAFRCLEQWYRDKVDSRHLASVSVLTSSASSLADMGYRFNVTYYSQQPFVQLRRLISPARVVITTNSMMSMRPFSTHPSTHKSALVGPHSQENLTGAATSNPHFMGALRIISRGEQTRGMGKSIGAKVPQRDPGMEPRLRSGDQAPNSRRQAVKIMHI